MLLKITQDHAKALIATRDSWDEKTRKRRKAAIFAQIKTDLGLKSTQKIKFEIDNPDSPDYLVVKDGVTGQRLQAPMTLPPKAAWPYPTKAEEAGTPADKVTPVKSNVKPALRGLTVNETMSHQVSSGHAVAAQANVRLKLGSVSLDDILELLRAEGETVGSYATSEDVASAPVFIKGDRLFFVR